MAFGVQVVFCAWGGSFLYLTLKAGRIAVGRSLKRKEIA